MVLVDTWLLQDYLTRTGAELTTSTDISDSAKKKIIDILFFAEQLIKENTRLQEAVNLLGRLYGELLIIEIKNGKKIIKFVRTQSYEQWAMEQALLRRLEEEDMKKKFDALLWDSVCKCWTECYSSFSLELSWQLYYISVIFDRRDKKRYSHDTFSIKLIPSKEFKKWILDSFQGTLKAAKIRDQDTASHLVRSSKYSELLAKKLVESWLFLDVITLEFIENIFYAAPLHDLWKIGVSDTILLKPGRLTSEEMDIMKTHTTLWKDLIASLELGGNLSNSLLSMAENISKAHHEKYNGTWYPHGITWEEIPLEARIVAVIDIFDAICSKRPYKEPWPLDKVYSHMVQLGKDKELDPIILNVFIENWDTFITLKEEIDIEFQE